MGLYDVVVGAEAGDGGSGTAGAEIVAGGAEIVAGGSEIVAGVAKIVADDVT